MIILPRVYTLINFQSHKYSSSLLLFPWTLILELSLPDIFTFLSSFNLKGYCYPFAWSCTLCEGDCSFCTGPIFRKLLEFLFVFFFRLALLNLVSYHFFFSQSPSSSSSLSSVCFDAILFDIDEVLSINLFVCSGFNVHQNNGLNYPDGTDTVGDPYYNLLHRKMTLFRWLTFLLEQLALSLRALLF